MWGDKEEEGRSMAGRSAEEAAGGSQDDPSTGLTTEEKKFGSSSFLFLFLFGREEGREGDVDRG